ncbi:LuxR C-terminal-related transcriptional regulator [Knoellia sp. p5-6-4]|uniref:LuxR C-terminal-related transcriptional regulator n=1 Tax=unclassified Knoellia TaxID=2618719 RepID=UPI0023DC3FD0|nr:LuxR C-terminal-related transcriptional regulator [Knoellia sp. p5-6-4]MDF2145513.1 LuxR C-terminal-related transcriptional regulator [Knoellia sp. p5-6-4]
MPSRPKKTGSSSSTATRSLLSAARYGIPGLPSPHVARPRLLSALAASEHTPLTLVSAPAGTGKTTLVADWARQRLLRSPTAWVTFDDGGDSLWVDLVLCLGRLGVPVPQVRADGTGTTRLSRSQLTTLAEGIASAPQRLTVVLDGYDLVHPDEARELHYLLEHTAGRLGLVLVTRVDPALPLYRYRLEDSLVELRVADLAFDDSEAATLLGRAGVALDAEVLHAVNTRVRGWAAGLRFAARALAGQDDVDRSAASAVTSAVDINEYLVGEVLDVQTSEVRDFLLETAVADVLSPALVTELRGPEARHVLAGLGHPSTFVEPVPGQPGCFRYYPFFKELLQAQLAYERPQRWAELHRTAATWCEREGLPDRALSHLAAIHAWQEVAALMVAADRVAVLLSEGDLAGPLWSAATRLPRELDAPEACAVRAAVSLVLGDAHTCAGELAAGRDGLLAAPTDAARPAPPVVAATLAAIDVARAAMDGSADEAAVLGEVAAEALEHARPSSLGVTNPGLVALLARCRGLTAMRRGDARRARAVLNEAAVSVTEASGMPSGILADVLGHLAVVDVLEGHLARAARTAEDSLALSDGKRSAAVCHGEAAAHIALGAIALERCHAKEARHHVSVAFTSPTLGGHPLCRALAEAVLAGVERAAGNPQAALTRLDSAADAAGRTDPWLADRLRVEAARLGLASGRTEQALNSLNAVEHQGMPQAAAVAAVAFAQMGQLTAVEDRLSHVRHNDPNLQTEVMALLAEGARDLQQNAPVRAHAALDRSLRLAAPEGMRRPFREGGALVQRLLSSDPVALQEHAWLAQGPIGDRPAGAAPHASSQHAVLRASEAPVEELTAKELEVLAHLAELLTTEEIAGRMFISVNTVRTHVRNILRKLAVNRRNAAIRRARELGLLGDSDATTASAS